MKTSDKPLIGLCGFRPFRSDGGGCCLLNSAVEAEDGSLLPERN
jgi:hypothetical protein